MKNKLVQKSKRLLSGIVATAIAASMLPMLPAMAEETTDKYPYTHFVAITGINIDTITNKTTLTISTWGHKACLFYSRTYLFFQSCL